MDFELAGAFTISDVTSPVYGIRPTMTDSGMPSSIIVRDTSLEDDQSLGLAGFIHMVHPRFKQWAPLTFGLGIEQGNDVSYYLGTSYRFARKAFLTAGLAWSNVDALPAGEVQGEAPSTNNVLTNLGSRTDHGFFIGVSYSFLTPGESFFKKATAVPGSDDNQ